jgi:hypothetical protein
VQPVNPYMPPQHADGITRPIGPPTTVGEILLAGLSLYGANAAAVIGVMVIWLPIELLQSYYEYFVADPSDIGRSFSMTIWIENLIGVIPIAGVIAIGNAAMKGERPSIWFGLHSGLEAWPRMVGTRIVVSIISILGLVACVGPGIYIAVRTTVAEQVAVIERMNPMASTQRSFQLTQGSFWRYFLLDVICVGFMFFVGALITIPSTILPEYDHWLLSAALALIVDIVSAWPVLVLVAAYWASAKPSVIDAADASGK